MPDLHLVFYQRLTISDVDGASFAPPNLVDATVSGTSFTGC